MIVITSIKSCLKVDYKIKIHNLHSWILLHTYECGYRINM